MKQIIYTFLFLGICTISMAQHVVKGTITDEFDEALIGATVIEKGTTNGTVTDFNGMFELNVASGDAVLQVSYTGITKPK